MGGGPNASPPTDTPPGGGTFPVDSSGNAYNPAWGSDGGFNWGALGKGVMGASSAIGSSAPGYNTSMPAYQQPANPLTIPISQTNAPGLIPTQQGDLMAILQRLLQGQGGGY